MFAERVRAHLNIEPLSIGDFTIAVTVSSGIAVLRAHDLTVTASLSRADAALYRAKQAGRDRVEAALV